MTALIAISTYVIQVSDVPVLFAAIAFGPWVGCVAGGLGTAIADLLGGYAPFAPLTFLAYAGEGLLAGYLALKRPTWLLPAWLTGVTWMALTYFVGELLFFGWGTALPDLLLNNLGQAAAGWLAIPLYSAVRAAYPPVAQMRLRHTWREL